MSDQTGSTTTWGGTAEMSAWEGLMWRAEGDARTSSTGILLEMLDGTPDWHRFRALHEETVRVVPRLRDRVVVPRIAIGQPVWTEDLNFDLDQHLEQIDLAPADVADVAHRDLLDLCEKELALPLDPARPPWAAVLVTGLPEGRSAYVLKFHHSLTDGVGLIQLLEIVHGPLDPSRLEPGRADSSRPSITGDSLTRDRVVDSVRGAPVQLLRGAGSVLGVLGRVASDPIGSASRASRFSQSLVRVLTPPAAQGSPLLAGSGSGKRFLTLEVPLADLRAAATTAGCSVNDAFVAAVLGGVRRYHEFHGTHVDAVPFGMPVSLRRAGDPMGGNRFAGVRLSGPVAELDPSARMQQVRTLVASAREEPAIGFLDHLSPILTKLPNAAIIELSASLTSASDVQVSNIRGLAAPVELAGVRVLRTFPLGPRPGVALMVAMITYDGTCCLGLNVDPDVFVDLEVLEQAMAEGFAEVVAVAPVRRKRATR
ncbi:MAG: hypothetical protein JWP74_3168 [Marmoricola sp.]|nr:hypothetical protein [Marmoricola sp.]